jgi:hypothetical protein
MLRVPAGDGPARAFDERPGGIVAGTRVHDVGGAALEEGA